MKIEKLYKSQKVADRWYAELTDGETIRINLNIVADWSLYQGRELTEEELSAIRNAASEAGAKSRALRMLADDRVYKVLTAARALDLRGPLTPAPATGAVVSLLRAAGVQGPGPDRHLSPEIQAVVDLVLDGRVRTAAEQHTGPLR